MRRARYRRIAGRNAKGAGIAAGNGGVRLLARRARLAQMTRDWAARHGFTLFPEQGYESVTLTCVNNGAKQGGRVVDVVKLQKRVKDQGYLIDGGYGKIKGTTFRISNMGDESEPTMNELIVALDSAMKQM